jgi:hypothetical protein
MKNLFEKEDYAEIRERLDKLNPQSEHQWGKMEVSQMMAHCSAALEVAQGDRTLKRGVLGLLFGASYKKKYVYDNSFKRNDPTDPTFKIVDERDFERERARLIKNIERFYQGGPDHVSKSVHPFFGKMTPIEWAQLSYNHLNHHFKQFNA